MSGVAAVATIFGVGAQASANRKAEKRADEQAAAEKVLAAEEAASIESETAESVRRAKDKAAKAEGTSRARAAASGVRLDGSLGLSLDSMSDEHTRQIEWMATAGASRARLALLGGEMRSDAASARADQFQAQTWGAIATGAGNIYSSGKDSGWWD